MGYVPKYAPFRQPFLTVEVGRRQSGVRIAHRREERSKARWY